MDLELKEVVRWALAWKRAWDETGIPKTGTPTFVTNGDHGLYKAVQNYERAAVQKGLE
jgi:hypothetical protein